MSRRALPSSTSVLAGVFTLLLAFRIANALTLRTFFQPDEFFQSLEPAWELAFGLGSNAWITWEWRKQLRSSLHPEIFAAVYRTAAEIADVCGLSLPARAELLIAAPKVTQAAFAALLDCYTWKLAEKVHGRGSRTAYTTLALSICSPWQWFCSTRTLSNCLETTISSVAVYYWPWHWPGAVGDREPDNLTQPSRLRLSLVLAAFACILRPTNLLIWLAISVPTLWQAHTRQRYMLVRDILFCGSAVLACSVASDRVYYQAWTLPPLRFLYFNIAQSLAVFYGRNRPDYYLTEGLPLLLTTALPFATIGLWQALRASGTEIEHATLTPGSPSGASKASNSKLSDAKPAPQPQSGDDTPESTIQTKILTRLAWTSIATTLTLSLISHKEVRFLYPVLPFLHVLSAKPLTSFITPPIPFTRRAILSVLLLANILLAGYVSQVHQRGVIDVLGYLRGVHEAKFTQTGTGNGNGSGNGNESGESNITTTVAFLMPCHSTPWRSHLVHPGISAWALTCEPPLHLSLSEHSTYLDEADQFYLEPGPSDWLTQNMESLSTISRKSSRSGRYWANVEAETKMHEKEGRREWPEYLVFFAQLEDSVKEKLEGTRYGECWRGFNSHFHDDWRRVGDVVVWCLGD
ncbi:glycosyltransferase family 22 protein [Amniculicola lignicola CBS 123094]|uniref:Mannosyltransferase n=1 Tax=Amniculicola lignicola CBS 123094 TaxID=1392246 RepID=A0A6A5WSG3_9PLEO|nr:glycosyltransferase family 22 protein [Amniculicola lignicola CBS 123094]